MEPVKLNPNRSQSDSCCLLCSRIYETQKLNLSDLLMKLYNLWDAEFINKVGNVFHSEALKCAHFCDECSDLICRGFEFKRKLTLIKKKIVNYLESSINEEEDSSLELRRDLQDIIRRQNFEQRHYSNETSEGVRDVSIVADADDEGSNEFTLLMMPEVELTEGTGQIEIKSVQADAFKSSVYRKPETAVNEASESDIADIIHEESLESFVESTEQAIPDAINKRKTPLRDAETSSTCEYKKLKFAKPFKILVKPKRPGSATTKYMRLQSRSQQNIASVSSNTESVPPPNRIDSDVDVHDLFEDQDVIYYDTPKSIVVSGIMTDKEVVAKKRRRLHRCLLCEEKFSSGISLNLHLQVMHNQGTRRPMLNFQCPFCQKEFRKSVFERLKSNGKCFCHHFGEKTVATVGNADCCAQPTFEKFAEVHLRGCKGLWYLKPQPEEYKEQCILCEQQHSLDFDYYFHLRTHYGAELSQLQLCPLCPFEMPVRDALNSGFSAHVTQTHGIAGGGKERYYCKGCNFFYMPLNPNLESGRLIPQEFARFKRFAQDHEGCRKSPKPRQTCFNCKWCSEVWKTPRDLIVHEATAHTKDLTVNCTHCDLKFFDSTDLRIHMTSHIKQHACEYCLQEYTCKTKLDNHIASVHTGERNYLCEECGSGFFSREKLNLHKTIHAKTRECPCPECGNLFRSFRDVRNHLRQVHKIRTFSVPKKKPEAFVDNQAQV